MAELINLKITYRLLQQNRPKTDIDPALKFGCPSWNSIWEKSCPVVLFKDRRPAFALPIGI